MSYYSDAVYFHYQVVPYSADLFRLCELHHTLMLVQEHTEADGFAADDFALASNGAEVERLLPLVLRFLWRVEARHLAAGTRVSPRPLLHVVTELLP